MFTAYCLRTVHVVYFHGVRALRIHYSDEYKRKSCDCTIFASQNSSPISRWRRDPVSKFHSWIQRYSGVPDAWIWRSRLVLEVVRQSPDCPRDDARQTSTSAPESPAERRSWLVTKPRCSYAEQHISLITRLLKPRRLYRSVAGVLIALLRPWPVGG